jgi:hypothetical protein
MLGFSFTFGSICHTMTGKRKGVIQKRVCEQIRENEIVVVKRGESEVEDVVAAKDDAC